MDSKRPRNVQLRLAGREKGWEYGQLGIQCGLVGQKGGLGGWSVAQGSKREAPPKSAPQATEKHHTHTFNC